MSCDIKECPYTAQDCPFCHIPDSSTVKYTQSDLEDLIEGSEQPLTK